MTEAAEEIQSAADPEANIIFGTSFNDRLGEEVMITVIATGFDGGKRRQSSRHESGQATTDGSTSIRTPRERDFLEELQRQREESADGDDVAARQDGELATAGARRIAAWASRFRSSDRARTTPTTSRSRSFLRRK